MIEKHRNDRKNSKLENNFQRIYIIKEKIREEYREILEDQIDKIIRLKYTGWSRLSNKLINGLTDKKENKTILEIMKRFRKIKKFHVNNY